MFVCPMIDSVTVFIAAKSNMVISTNTFQVNSILSHTMQ
jgi:hypothetical protein